VIITYAIDSKTLLPMLNHHFAETKTSIWILSGPQNLLWKPTSSNECRV